MPRSPVFIVGSPRSGTSALVDVLIAAGYRGYREGNFLPVAYRINEVVDRHFTNYDIKSDKVLVSQVDKERLKSRVFDVFKTVMEEFNPEAPWFDKSGNPEMILSLPSIFRMWPSSVAIFAKRRGIENVASRVKKFPNQNFDFHCRDWALNMSSWRKVREQLDPTRYIEIEQQDMIIRPSETAEALARFLTLDDDSHAAAGGMMTRTRPQETEAGSANRVQALNETGWSSQQMITFSHLCKVEMDAFGYSMDQLYSKPFSTLQSALSCETRNEGSATRTR